jgi:zinc resistance-associated protein
MKNINSNKVIALLAVVAIIGFGSYAFAYWGDGYGYGHHGWMHYGPGMMGYGYGAPSGPGYGYPGNLSDEQITALQKEQNDFYRATEKIRQDIYTKQLALQNELAGQNPDTQKASELQKEISELQGKLDQQRIDYAIKMRKISPDAGPGFTGGYYMGNGYPSGGYCWR